VSAEILKTVLGISAKLARAGVPPLSPYWRGECERFYLHPTARLLVECVGRGGDKSRTSVIMAIAEVLAGKFTIAPGERHYFTHVSENREEAHKTLAVLEQYLRILKIPATPSGDIIELENMPRGFRVLACRVGAVSGYRCIGWTGDENAKWNSAGSDPSHEIVSSIKAMSVTHREARGRIVSSPLATFGHFFEVWKRGDLADQLVGHAPSWVANPSITEEQTHALEGDPRKHAREYGAVPLEGHEESLYDPGLIDRARREEPGDVAPEPGQICFAAMDPSLGRNAWTLAIVGKRVVRDRTKASVLLAREWRAPRGQNLDPAAVLATVDALCRPYAVERVWTDQFHGESLASIAQRMRLSIQIVVDKPTASERLERYESTLTRLLDDSLELPHDRQLRADLLAVRRQVTKGSDAFTISMAVTSDGRHADYAPSVVLALAQMDRRVAGQGILDWMAEQAARATGGPSTSEGRLPEVPELVALRVPVYFPTGLFTSRSGGNYPMQDTPDGRVILVNGADTEEIEEIRGTFLRFARPEEVQLLGLLNP
jgi:hypothetical protein